MFFVTATGNLEHCFILETNFPKDENLYKKLEYRFSVQSLKLKAQYFYIKLPIQKPMLRQIEWVVKKWTYRKERSFVKNYFIFWKT